MVKSVLMESVIYRQGEHLHSNEIPTRVAKDRNQNIVTPSIKRCNDPKWRYGTVTPWEGVYLNNTDPNAIADLMSLPSSGAACDRIT